ncbi:catalase [Altererythrobacter sp. SALINAS58]|nr:catalase [Alteripontixanthobacter muriae]
MPRGTAVADNQNWLKAGARGPGLLEDQIAREKISHFDHKQNPERIVHARYLRTVENGAGGHPHANGRSPAEHRQRACTGSSRRSRAY